jgi:TetR/AcrR family transcriptional regulator, regulator of cefoperazone and chloramphenicol sensitivity
VSAPPPLSPADHTRRALVLAALKLFGRQGFAGASTREIAALAGANIGSIAYHFGGKEGLRLAAADHIVETLQGIGGRALGDLDATPAAGPEAAREQLAAALEAMVGFVVAQPEGGDVVRFMLREMSQPTAALDRIYAGVIEPTHRRLCQVWEHATGESAESESAKLAVFTLIGQVLYFRIGREAVLRRMGWSTIGPRQAASVVAVIRDNLEGILEQRKGGAS